MAIDVASIHTEIEKQVKATVTQQVINSITTQTFHDKISEEFKNYARSIDPRNKDEIVTNVLQRLTELESKSGTPGNEVFLEGSQMKLDTEFLPP